MKKKKSKIVLAPNGKVEKEQVAELAMRKLDKPKEGAVLVIRLGRAS